MQLRNFVLALSVVLACSPTLAAVAKKGLKQATRGEVVQRLSNARPLRPRQSPSSCVLPSGAPPTSVVTTSCCDLPYDLVIATGGLTEDPDNPGAAAPPNPNIPSVTTNIGYYGTAADAILACANTAATDLTLSQAWSFDLHFLQSLCTWECVQYPNPQLDSSYFDVYNSDAVITYGYSYNPAEETPCVTPTGTPQPQVTSTKGDILPYNLVIASTGLTEDPNNPGSIGGGNPNIKSVSTNLGYIASVTDAIQTCANTASTDLQVSVAWSFDLHFLDSICSWECVQYPNPQPSASYFDVANSDVALVYGYTYAY